MCYVSAVCRVGVCFFSLDDAGPMVWELEGTSLHCAACVLAAQGCESSKWRGRPTSTSTSTYTTGAGFSQANHVVWLGEALKGRSCRARYLLPHLFYGTKTAFLLEDI